MNKREQAIQFQKDISSMNIKSFNFYAFIFSSLFYFKNDMNLKFFLYLFLPMIFAFPIAIIIRNFPDAFICGLFLAHILAGFRGNIDLYKHKVRFLKKYEHLITEQSDEEKKEKEIVYFCISPTRLVVCSLLTCGLYDIYWLYKNWKAVGDATDKNINPILRSWVFALLFFYPLFQNIKKNVGKFNPVSIWFKIAAVFYILCFFCSVVAASIEMKADRLPDADKIMLSLTYFLLTLVCSFLLIPIQRAINFYNKSIEQKIEPATMFSIGEVVVIFLGFFSNYVVLFIG